AVNSGISCHILVLWRDLPLYSIAGRSGITGKVVNRGCHWIKSGGTWIKQKLRLSQPLFILLLFHLFFSVFKIGFCYIFSICFSVRIGPLRFSALLIFENH